VVSGLAVLRSNVECILLFTNDPPISLLFLSLSLSLSLSWVKDLLVEPVVAGLSTCRQQ
jgi:hypothetical protein